MKINTEIVCIINIKILFSIVFLYKMSVLKKNENIIKKKVNNNNVTVNYNENQNNKNKMHNLEGQEEEKLKINKNIYGDLFNEFIKLYDDKENINNKTENNKIEKNIINNREKKNNNRNNTEKKKEKFKIKLKRKDIENLSELSMIINEIKK